MSAKLPTNKERAERALEALESGRLVFINDLGDQMDIPGTLVARPGGGALEPKLARALARKYLWWLDPDEAVRQPDRLVAQVMNMGTFEDARTVEGQLGEAFLRGVLERAAPGWFDERPWTFWHYRLGLAKPGRVPDPPRRRFG